MINGLPHNLLQKRKFENMLGLCAYFISYQLLQFFAIADLVLSNKLVLYDLVEQAIGWTDYNCEYSGSDLISCVGLAYDFCPYYSGILVLSGINLLPYFVAEYLKYFLLSDISNQFTSSLFLSRVRDRMTKTKKRDLH